MSSTDLVEAVEVGTSSLDVNWKSPTVTACRGVLDSLITIMIVCRVEVGDFVYSYAVMKSCAILYTNNQIENT